MSDTRQATKSVVKCCS